MERSIPRKYFIDCGGDASIQAALAAAVYIAWLTTGKDLCAYLDTSKRWDAALRGHAVKVLHDIIPGYINPSTPISSGGKSVNKTTKLLRRAKNYIETLERGQASLDMSQEAASKLEQMGDALMVQKRENQELWALLKSHGMAVSQVEQALRRACRGRAGS